MANAAIIETKIEEMRKNLKDSIDSISWGEGPAQDALMTVLPIFQEIVEIQNQILELVKTKASDADMRSRTDPRLFSGQ